MASRFSSERARPSDLRDAGRGNWSLSVEGQAAGVNNDSHIVDLNRLPDGSAGQGRPPAFRWRVANQAGSLPGSDIQFLLQKVGDTNVGDNR